MASLLPCSRKAKEKQESTFSLDQEFNHIYTAGERVSGFFILQPAYSSSVKSIRIYLQGQCFTSSWLDRSNPVKTTCIFDLFTHSTVISRNWSINTGQRIPLRFELSFPKYCVSRLADKKSPKTDMFTQSPQTLPDSFAMSTGDLFQSVRYFLRVELEGRCPPQPEEYPLAFRQMRKSDGCRLSLPNKLNKHIPIGQLLSPSWVPHFLRHLGCVIGLTRAAQSPPYVPSIYLPSCITIGQEIPLLLSVQLVSPPPKAHRLILDHVAITVTAHTRITVDRTHVECIELSYLGLSAKSLGAVICPDGESHPLTKNLRLDARLIPSFKTFTIARSYTIEIEFVIRHGQDVCKWTKSQDLTIHPNHVYPLIESSGIEQPLLLRPDQAQQKFWHTMSAESTSRCADPCGPPKDLFIHGSERLLVCSYAMASASLPSTLAPQPSWLSCIYGSSGIVRGTWTYRPHAQDSLKGHDRELIEELGHVDAVCL